MFSSTLIMTWNIDMNNIAKLDTFKYLMFEPNVESIAYADFIFNPKKQVV